MTVHWFCPRTLLRKNSGKLRIIRTVPPPHSCYFGWNSLTLGCQPVQTIKP